MPLPRRWGLTGLAAAALLAGAVGLAAAPAPGPAYTSVSLAHYPGGLSSSAGRAPKPGPRLEMYRTGFKGAGEPNIAVGRDGAVYSDVFTKVVASRDKGKTWKDISPGHPTSIDPYLYLDTATQRLYKSDLAGTCQLLSWTDNRGESWTTSAAACNQSDHQTIFAGKPTLSPTVGYPRVLYNCSQTAGYNGYSLASGCAKSLDGGLTWAPTGSYAFQDPSPYGVGPGSGDGGIPGVCIGDIGPMYVDDKGTVLIPRGWCGQPWLAISKDEGATWTRTEVARNGMSTSVSGGFGPVAPGSGQSEHEAAAVADKAGNIYFLWMALDRLPYLAVSRDGGKTFGKPMMVGAPGLKEAWGPALDIDDRGRVALAYMGTTNSPGKPWTASYSSTTWSGYLGRIDKPLAAKPLVRSGPVSPATYPLVRGACGPHRCNAGVLDFIDVAIGPDGATWGAFVDTANTARELVIGRLAP
ncbi:MAG TPA: sialidase family protein [Mycobacteriales bacterium]|nr:sialidase family protein [Mycobacteriales bacterium]